jgi:GGDEF domain-containing protein
MARLAESSAAPLTALAGLEGDARDDVAESAALALAGDLQRAVDRFLNRPSDGATRSATEYLRVAANPCGEVGSSVSRDAIAERAGGEAAALLAQAAPLKFLGPARDEFDVRLKLAVGHCRSTREPLSVMLLAVEALKTPAATATIERLLDSTCDEADVTRGFVEQPAAARRILVLVGRDRRDAVSAARRCVERLREELASLESSGQAPSCKVAAGVAAVGVPAKNFQAALLLETAQRCLAAALASGGVKSLEVS